MRAVHPEYNPVMPFVCNVDLIMVNGGSLYFHAHVIKMSTVV